MAAPFNMPDEFIHGFFKSGQTLLQAYTGASGKIGETPSTSSGIPALALAESEPNRGRQFPST